MAVIFQYENDKQGIIVTAIGIVEGKEFLNKMRESFSDEQTIRNYRYGLNDFTQVEKFNISSSQLFSLAKLHIKASKINTNLIVGFAINKPFLYGIVRVWMAYAATTGWQINIEKTLPEIKGWISAKLDSI